MAWYDELDYENNPMEVNPFKADFEITRNIDELNEFLYYLKSGNMVLVEGRNGSGKTTMLKAAVDSLRRNGRMIYFDCKSLSKNLNVEDLLQKSQNIFRRISGRKPHNIILLLDNVRFLTGRNAERIKNYFDMENIKSVAFTTEDYEMIDFSGSLKDRIGKRIIRITEPTMNDVIEMTNGRLSEDDALDKKLIRKIYEISNKNIKQHLINCEVVLEYLYENEKDDISEKELKSLISDNIYEERDNTKICHKCHNELKWISNNWRCENCENFCLACGSMVENDDVACPECGVKFIE